MCFTGFHIQMQIGDTATELTEGALRNKLLSAGGAHAASHYEFGASEIAVGEGEGEGGRVVAEEEEEEEGGEEGGALGNLVSGGSGGSLTFYGRSGWMSASGGLEVAYECYDAWSAVLSDDHAQVYPLSSQG